MIPYTTTKRFFDITFALAGLLLLVPLFLPIMLILKLTAEGEVFYKQNRIGYNKNIFGIWKFATMLKNSPNIGTGSLTLRNDPRVTHIGRFLRKTKINELPQLFNVLTGDMSFVGPRPQMQVDFDVYPPHVKEKICTVPPGITGIGSIIFRDEEELLSSNDIDPKLYYATKIAPYKGTIELWYIENQSFYIDIMILILTMQVVMFPESTSTHKIFKNLPPNPLMGYHKTIKS